MLKSCGILGKKNYLCHKISSESKEHMVEKKNRTGNEVLATYRKTAFLCPGKYSKEDEERSIAWANSFSATDADGGKRCVTGGFQTGLETDILRILLQRHVPVIVMVAQQIPSPLPTELQKAVEAQEALVVSTSDNVRTSRAEALNRNNLVVKEATEVVFPSEPPASSSLRPIFTKLISENLPTILLCNQPKAIAKQNNTPKYLPSDLLKKKLENTISSTAGLPKPLTAHNGSLKILHTSDWHLGQTLYGYDRTEEQVAMLLQMVRLVAEHRPDVLLVSGDIYHTAQPAAAVQTLFTNAIVELHNAHPQMTIIITAGNHDSATRHEIFREPWQALNVHAVGTIDREHPENHIIDIAGKGYVVAVPYCNERNLPEGFLQGLLDRVAEQNRESQLPVVMMAHTTVSGCDFQGHDNATEYVVGGIDSMSIDDFGHGYDYLALGHIHHGQWVAGGGHRVRYSGTPVAVSFDESYAHNVTLLSLGKHGDKPTDVHLLPIDNPRPLVTLPTEGMATWDEAQTLLQEFPADIPAYIRLNVVFDDLLPADANSIAEALTADKRCRFCLINAKRLKAKLAATKTFTVQEFQEQSPIDIARLYAEDMGVAFDEEMTEMFHEALRQSNETA